MNIINCDIAVIGLGPAGFAFCRFINSDKKVVVIDRKSDDSSGFTKPCGGLLSYDAQRLISEFNLTLPKDILVDPQIFSVKTIDLKSRITRHYQRGYVNIDRKKLDHWLSDLIPDCIQRLFAHCTTLEKNDEGYTIMCVDASGSQTQVVAPVIIGADGANSIVRRTFFPHKKMRKYVAIQQWFDDAHPSPFYSCIFDPETTDCCAWSISKNRYFIYGGAFPLKNCRQAFERQKKKLESHGYIFGTPHKTEACVVLRPATPFDFCTGGGGVFLIGEAAGFISPSSLEGISYALSSGRLLASSLNEKDSLPYFSQKSYKRKTLPLRIKIILKLLKCPFMYQPTLRRLVMASRVLSIKIDAPQTDEALDSSHAPI